MYNSNNMQTNCGTYTAWRAHQKRKEAPCDACRAARNEYLAGWRERNKAKLKEYHAEWREDNKERVKQYREEYYQEHKETYYEQNKAWRANNVELMRSYRNTWKENNPEAYKEAQRKWEQEHPERNRVKEGRRRARKRETQVEDFTEQQVLDAYGLTCHICQKEIDIAAPRRTNKEGWERGMHLDHLTPLSKGGTHTLDNIRPAHGLCNVRKAAKIIEVHAN